MSTAQANPLPTIQVGILTKGRPMLATVIANMVLQEEHPLEIFIVDTGDQPAIKRVDVISVLRLAGDRGVRCEYEVHRDRQRAFSGGRLKLLESMRGPLLAFMDDDIVLAGSTAMAGLGRRAMELGNGLGWVAPYCVNAGGARGFLKDQPHYSPGGIFAQDEVIRNILLEYYNNNTDVLDARGPRERVWELEFLTELFPALNRTIEVQHETVSYHLDYDGGTRWDLMEDSLLAATRRELHRLVAKYARATAPG
jgi:hypothetical protein